MMRILLIAVAVLVVAAAGAFFLIVREPEIGPIARPDPASFDPEVVARGESLAGIGNCAVCHTRQGGARYAGGLPLPSDFGMIYSTNITPDPETGIGAWSQEAFFRAMQRGVDRSGRHLYPAFPYDYYTRVTEEDLAAIYAFLMSQEPVVYEAPEPALPFPFNVRPILAGWNLLFLDEGEFQPDPAMDADWNRGAYLVEGLGHCGACHSPRNRFGAPARTAPGAYSGAHIEGWYAPPLNVRAPGQAPWTEIALVNYLIDGWDEHHGIAAGPMLPVVNDLYDQSEDDVFAMAAYLLSLPGAQGGTDADAAAAAEEAVARAEALEWGHPDAPAVPDDPLIQRGAQVFERECTECHRSGGRSVPLTLTPSPHAPDAANLIWVTLRGIQPPPRGALNRSMPGRALQISDEEMVALAAFVRSRYSTEPPWDGVAAQVEAIRAAEGH